MLTLVIETPVAISLLTLPIIFTNLFQYLGCENRIEIAKSIGFLVFYNGQHFLYILIHHVFSQVDHLGNNWICNDIIFS